MNYPNDDLSLEDNQLGSSNFILSNFIPSNSFEEEYQNIVQVDNSEKISEYEKMITTLSNQMLSLVHINAVFANENKELKNKIQNKIGGTNSNFVITSILLFILILILIGLFIWTIKNEK